MTFRNLHAAAMCALRVCEDPARTAEHPAERQPLGSVGRARLAGPPLHYRDQAWFEDLQAIEEGEDLVAGPRRDRVCGAGVNRRARYRCLRVRHVDPSITLSDVEGQG
jgi:hypothetical protein